MNKILLSLILVFITFPTGANQAVKSNANDNVAEAKAAIKQLAGSLKKELKASMQSGGPIAVIGVCNTLAMPITDQVATEHGLLVSRVSLKNRNPINAANDWQTAVLEDFERQKSVGKDISKIAWTETVDVEGGQEFRLSIGRTKAIFKDNEDSRGHRIAPFFSCFSKNSTNIYFA